MKVNAKKKATIVRSKTEKRRTVCIYVSYVLIAVIVLTGATFARYTYTVTGTDSGTLTATIELTHGLFTDSSCNTAADFNVAQLTASGNNSATVYLKLRSFSVISGTSGIASTVAQSVETNISLTSNIGFTVTASTAYKSQNNEYCTSISGSGTSNLTLNGDRLFYGDTCNIYAITISWPAGTTDAELAGMMDALTVTATGTQIV